jgi:mono/diheme cytochrome c family protein
VVASSVDWRKPEGAFLLQDVYRGLTGIARGRVKALRVVGVPPKTQPAMNAPNLGVTSDDPGKYVLGTVPVAADGSAYFHAPAGANVFFQAVDAEGLAVQTMRTVTTVQPGQTLSCIGCHESRSTAPAMRRPQAVALKPSRITPAPEGSWPLRYDRLVQPVLDRRCAQCHQPQGANTQAAALDLSEVSSYDRLVTWGKPSMADHVRQGYYEGKSVPGNCEAQQSALLRMLRRGHHGVALEADDLERLVTWMDTYAQRQGAFSADQETRLTRLRDDYAGLLAERPEAR